MNIYKELRKKLNLNQKELAKKVGVTQTSVSRWEKDKSLPDYGTLRNLSEVFGVSIDYLLGNTELPVVQPQPLTIEQAKDLWLNSLDPEDKTTITMLLDLDFKNKLKVQGYIMSLSGQVSV